MRIHSIVETPEQPLTYEAYLPLPDLVEDNPVLGMTTPFFEATVVDAAGPMRLLTTVGEMPRIGHVKGVAVSAGSVDVDLVVGGNGLKDTVLRVEPEIANYVDRDAIILQPQVLGMAKKGLRFRKLRVTFVPDSDQEPWVAPAWLPLARIHRPAVDGCVTTYTVTTANISEYDASFEFAGLGAGGSVSFSTTFGRQYPASASCKEARVRATVSLVFGTTLIDDEPVSSGTRVTISDVQPNVRSYADIPTAMDDCGWELERIPARGRTDEDLTEASGGSADAPTDTKTIKGATSGKISLGLNFGRAPVKISAAYTRNCEHTVELSSTFMPGARYIGYQPSVANELEKCWSVIQPSQGT